MSAGEHPASHLPTDLAGLHDGLQALREEVARREFTLPCDAPERGELRAAAEGIGADLETLRDPAADRAELDWVRSLWAGIDPARLPGSWWPVTPAWYGEAGTPATKLGVAS
jgi:hypothetical protein